MHIFIYSLSDAIQNNFGKIGYIIAKKKIKIPIEKEIENLIFGYHFRKNVYFTQ
jgi:hypothetical protein